MDLLPHTIQWKRCDRFCILADEADAWEPISKTYTKVLLNIGGVFSKIKERRSINTVIIHPKG